MRMLALTILPPLLLFLTSTTQLNFDKLESRHIWPRSAHTVRNIRIGFRIGARTAERSSEKRPVRLQRRAADRRGYMPISPEYGTPDHLSTIDERDESSPSTLGGSLTARDKQRSGYTDDEYDDYSPRPRDGGRRDPYSRDSREAYRRSKHRESTSSMDSFRSSDSGSSGWSENSDSVRDREEQRKFFPLTDKNKKSLHLVAQSTLAAIGVTGFGAAVGLGVARHLKLKKCKEENRKDCEKKPSILQRALGGNGGPINAQNNTRLQRRGDGDFPSVTHLGSPQKRSVDPDFDENVKQPLRGEETPRTSQDRSAQQSQREQARSRQERAQKEQQDQEKQKTQQDQETQKIQQDQESKGAQAGLGHQKISPSSSDFGTAFEGSLRSDSRGRIVTMPAEGSGGSADHAVALAGASNPRQISGRPSTAYEGEDPGRPRSRGPSPAYQTGRALSPILTEQEMRSPRSERSYSGSSTAGSSSTGSYGSSSYSSSRSSYSTGSTGSYTSTGSYSSSSSSRPNRSAGRRSTRTARGGRSAVVESSREWSGDTASTDVARRRRYWRGAAITGGVGVVGTAATLGAIKAVRDARCRTDPDDCTSYGPGGKARKRRKEEHLAATRQPPPPTNNNQPSKQAGNPPNGQPGNPPGTPPIGQQSNQPGQNTGQQG